MQQRGTVVMQSRAGLLQPVRVDPKKQRAFGTAKVSRAGDRGQMPPARRMAEHQGGDTGDRLSPTPPPHPPPHPPPQFRRGTPQDLAARRQMQREMQEAQAMDAGMAGGMGRARPPRAMMVPLDRLPPEIVRQLPQGPITLHYGHPPPHVQPGYFPPSSPKHFSSKSGEPPDRARQGPPRRGVGAMAHLASPVRVSSNPTGLSPREPPGAASPRELRLSSPRPVNSPRATDRGLGDDTASPRYASDAEKTPRSVGGRQEGSWKASPRPVEAPTASPRGAPVQGDAGATPEGRRGVPKDRGEERLLRNLNQKAVESKGGRVPDRGKLATNPAVPASELNKGPNDASVNRAGGAAIYQMDRKGQFGRGGGVGPPQREPQGGGPAPYGPRPGQFPGPQHQMPTPAPGRVPMSTPKLNPTRTSAATPRMAALKKAPTVLAKKSTLSPPKQPTAFSPALLISSPATSPMNSPRPSLMHAAPSGKLRNASKASPGSSPTRVLKSPRNSPARTYVVTPKESPPEPAQRTPMRSPQTTSAANISAKLQMDSSAPQATNSPTTGNRKGKYQNPKTRLSAGGDLEAAKGRPKAGPHRVGAGEAASPPGEKFSPLSTAQNQPFREANEARNQPKEPSELNKGQMPTKASPLVRKLTKTSLLPVQNPSTPRSVVSQHLPEEDQGKSGNTVAQGTPRKGSAGEGNRRLPLSARNRKGAITGTAHTEGTGARESTRPRPATARPRRGRKDSLDVAAALPDTSGNYTSAVHQWLRQSHYKVISPQQYRQHETIQEETVKQTGPAEKATAFKEERKQKEAVPEPEKAPAPPEKPGRRGRVQAARCGDVARSLSPLSTRYQPSAKAPRPLRRAPLSLLMMKHKEAPAIPKMAAASAAARAGKKASKAAAAAVPSVESGKRRGAAKRASPKGAAAKGRGPRRRKERERAGKLPPSACPRLRPKVGPAGDSGDLSSSTEDSSYLSASDEAMNEQSAVC